MEKQTFEFGKISERISFIVDDTKKIVSAFDNESVQKFAKDINEIQNQKLLTIAFIGQYSAGKSTIISALTGNKSIKIDADIATDKTTDYAWNNVLLTDTPGLFTEREDHDDITYKKIKESDLLVYCLTSDLFDDIILNNFNKIAFTELQKNKMMVVINKMSMEAGDYDTLVKNYKVTLNNSLRPNSFDDFPHCFIDAADYISGIDENEDDLIGLSHFNDFIKIINTFINEKGIWAKLATPIYKTISFIDNSILDLSSKDNKEFLMLVNRIEREVQVKKQMANNRVSTLIINLASTIINYSNDIINKIGVEKIDFDNIQREIEAKIKKDAEETQKQIESILDEVNEDLDNSIKDLFDSDLGKYVLEQLKTEKLNITNESITDFSKVMANFSTIKGITNTVAGQVKNFIGVAPKGGDMFLKAGNLAGGNQAVELVKNVGHFFGVKFQPWGAINLVKNVGNVVNILGPVLSVFSLGMEIAIFLQEESNIKKLAEAKQGCYNEFSNISKNIENQFTKQLNDYSKATFDTVLNQIKDLRSNMISEEKSSNESVLKLKEYKKELENMLVLSEK